MANNCVCCCCCCPGPSGNSRGGARGGRASASSATRDLCCNRKITWPICIGLFHVGVYLSVIVLNGLNLVEAIITLTTSRHLLSSGGEGEGEGDGDGDGGGSLNSNDEDIFSKRRKVGAHFSILSPHSHESTDEGPDHNGGSTELSSELMIVHSICILILASVGFCISFNLLLLKGSKQEIARSLKLWLVYTVVFCLLIVPYYVWRLSTSEHVGRWLIQLVATNSVEGYFLGIAYSLITELTADPSQGLMGRGSSKFHALQSRESQITFVGEVTNLKTFTEIKI